MITWEQTDAVLISIRRRFAVIHETPAKEHTPEQLQELKLLRQQSVEIGRIRYQLLQGSEHELHRHS